MTRTALILPFVALCGAAAYFGYQAGRIPSETELIDSFAARYIQERGQGARLTDCEAYAGVEPVRIELRCRHADGDLTIYRIGKRGANLGPIPHNGGNA